MPKHYTMINLHHLILLGTCVWVQNVESITGACQVLSAVPIPCESLLQVKHCCTLQRVVGIHTLFSKMNVCCLVPSAQQKLDDAVLCLIGQICDNSPLCRHYSEQSAYEICPSWSVVTPVGRHKNDQPYITHNPTIHVVRLFHNKHYIFVVFHTTKWAKHSNNGPILQENIQMFHKEFAVEECDFTASTELLHCWEMVYRVRQLNIWGEILLALSKSFLKFTEQLHNDIKN